MALIYMPKGHWFVALSQSVRISLQFVNEAVESRQRSMLIRFIISGDAYCSLKNLDSPREPGTRNTLQFVQERPLYEGDDVMVQVGMSTGGLKDL